MSFYQRIAGTKDGLDDDNSATEVVKSTSNALHVSHAADYWQINTSQVIGPKGSVFYGFSFISVGVLGFVTVFDGVDATGAVLIPRTAALLGFVGGAGPGTPGVRAKNGIYVRVEGTTPPLINLYMLST